MTASDGRAGMLTPRDYDIFTDLFFCRYLTLRQLAVLHFLFIGDRRRNHPVKAAKTCLYNRLKKKGRLTNRVLSCRDGTRLNVFHLTKDTFEEMAETLGFEERWNNKQLGVGRMQHFVETNDLYVEVKRHLDDYLGEYPAWVWKNEKRSLFIPYQAPSDYEYRPDAEISFGREGSAPTRTFVVERQTSRSRKGPEEIYDRVRDRARHIETLPRPENAFVLFCCDEKRDGEMAARAARQHGINLQWGDPTEMAGFLARMAREYRDELRAKRRNGGDPAAPPE